VIEAIVFMSVLGGIFTLFTAYMWNVTEIMQRSIEGLGPDTDFPTWLHLLGMIVPPMALVILLMDISRRAREA